MLSRFNERLRRTGKAIKVNAYSLVKLGPIGHVKALRISRKIRQCKVRIIPVEEVIEETSLFLKRKGFGPEMALNSLDHYNRRMAEVLAMEAGEQREQELSGLQTSIMKAETLPDTAKYSLVALSGVQSKSSLVEAQLSFAFANLKIAQKILIDMK